MSAAARRLLDCGIVSFPLQHMQKRRMCCMPILHVPAPRQQDSPNKLRKSKKEKQRIAVLLRCLASPHNNTLQKYWQSKEGSMLPPIKHDQF